MSLEWKPIVGYEPYQVSNTGIVRVWRMKRWKVLKTAAHYITGYIKIGLWKKGIRKDFLLHRLVFEAFIGEIPKGFNIDHINRDNSDNRVENLRLATQSQNVANTLKAKNKTSQYKGVSRTENGRWLAGIKVNGKSISLGTYDTEIEAAYAYDKKALEFFKEYAVINFVQQ